MITPTVARGTSSMQTYDEDLLDMLSNITHIHSKFCQTLLNRQEGITKISTGELWVSKPNFFKLQIKTPQKQMLLYNQGKFWNYEEDLEQVTISEVPKNISNVPYLLILTGDIPTLKEFFNIEKVSENSYCLKSKAKDNSLITSININFANKTLKSMLIQTEVGQSTLIEFYDIYTSKISTLIYQFTPPDGVDILD